MQFLFFQAEVFRGVPRNLQLQLAMEHLSITVDFGKGHK